MRGGFDKVKALFLAWQDPDTRRWLPVGQLTHKNGRYRFGYTKGALVSKNFVPFGPMRDLRSVYESTELFPLFANRILSKNRPEYKQFLHWLNVPEDTVDQLSLLARTEGIRGTDSLRVFPCPERHGNGPYQVHFFSHGLRYLPSESLQAVEELKPGTRLYLMLDAQNEHDSCAIALRAEQPTLLVGYAPRYFAADFRKVLLGPSSETVQAFVERVNPGAPTQLRLLCRITAAWPKGFRPCTDSLYQPLTPSKKVKKAVKRKR